MQRLIEILKTKKGRGALLGAIAAIVYMMTGYQIPEDKLNQADQAIEATVDLAAPATAPTATTSD